MRGARVLAAAALLLSGACMVQASVPRSGGSVPAQPSESPEAAEARVAELVNSHRAARGCLALVRDERAARVARAHSQSMESLRFFSHTGRDGSGPAERLSAAGVRWRAVAENIARDPRGADAVVRGWLDSPGHRANVENCAYTHHGVGRSGELWTHLFFTPAG